MLQPQIVEKAAFTVVGCQEPFIHALSPDANNQKVIGALWDRFVHRQHEVRNREGKESYGIVHALPENQRSHPHELLYIAAVRVASAGDLPAGMIAWTVPAGTYAIFLHKGPIRNIAATGTEIYRQWLPQSEYEHAHTCDVELYDHRFKGNADDSEMEWWLPVLKKPAGRSN
jgi:AraC family transcriptional regulator